MSSTGHPSPKTAARSWIRRLLTADPPRAKSLVVTVFGDAIAPYEDRIRLKSLIQLLEPFEVNERLARTSVFRLVKEDWLRGKRNGRESFYQLTESGRRRLWHAYEKIYERKVDAWNGTWTLIMIASAKFPLQCRKRLREELEWEGFRQLVPHVFGHPRIPDNVLAELLDREEVRGNVITFNDSKANQVPDLRQVIEQRWAIDSVVRRYRSFLQDFGRIQRLIAQPEALSPEQWFTIRILMIHAYRRAVLHDPLLPGDLLPYPWIGDDAYRLAGQIYRTSLPGSESY
ncbi:MAG: phenylacetic acid degradation operon negative regulatory protein PaaX, partial [Verrucomicrobia bacterium]|nr:phenylacetic acid degradation operon negative regulatory protein PaaX [Verrucomicrobiota bacterium]